MKIITINNHDINISQIEHFKYTPASPANVGTFGDKIPNTEKDACLLVVMPSGKRFTVNGEEATKLHGAIKNACSDS